VGTILVRRLEARNEPTLGAILARAMLVSWRAEGFGRPYHTGHPDAGWESIPIGEILGDGAPWIWNVAEAHSQGVRQTLDYYISARISMPLPISSTPPTRLEPTPGWSRKWGALLIDRVGEVLRALKRLRPMKKTVRERVIQLIGYVERNEPDPVPGPWYAGLAVGPARGGACTHVIQVGSSEQHALEAHQLSQRLGIAALPDSWDFQAFGPAEGLAGQASG